MRAESPSPSSFDTARARIVPVLRRMVDRANLSADAEERFWTVFDLLTAESLGFQPSVEPARFSGISQDGTPWQFCTVLGAGATSVRYLTEVGVPGSTKTDRTNLTQARVREILDLLRVPAGADLASTMTGLAPVRQDALAYVWVAVAASSSGSLRIRLYTNNGWGSLESRWLRLVDTLRSLGAGGFGARLEPHLPVLLPTFGPAGFAITLPSSPLLCKLYLRPHADPWSSVRSLATSILGPEVSRRLLDSIEHGCGRTLESLPTKALVMSVAGTADGGPLDLKLDLCGHCLFDGTAAATEMIQRAAGSLGLDTGPYHAMRDDIVASGRSDANPVAFVGIGATPLADYRVNVYLLAPAVVPP